MVAGPCSDAVKSGTESFNCPDDGNLCDMNHVNVGGADMNEVIFVTKMVDKKNTMAINKAKTTNFCDVNHIWLS